MTSQLFPATGARPVDEFSETYTYPNGEIERRFSLAGGRHWAALLHQLNQGPAEKSGIPVKKVVKIASLFANVTEKSMRDMGATFDEGIQHAVTLYSLGDLCGGPERQLIAEFLETYWVHSREFADWCRRTGWTNATARA